MYGSTGAGKMAGGLNFGCSSLAFSADVEHVVGVGVGVVGVE